MSSSSSSSFSNLNKLLLHEKMYVHPVSGSFLSLRSLEMCTESLGSESGSAIEPPVDRTAPEYRKTPIAAPKLKCVEKKKSYSFPPPLTSIALHIHSQREEGRLVIKASKPSSCSTHFGIERHEGRLRLYIISNNWEGVEEPEDETDTRRPWDATAEEEDGGGCCVINCGEWSGNRCNGESHHNDRLRSLPYCVAIS